MTQRIVFVLAYLAVILLTVSAEEEKKTKHKRGAETDRQDILYGGWSPILPGHRYYFGPRYASAGVYQAQQPYIINPTNQAVHVHEDNLQFSENDEADKDYQQGPELDTKSAQSLLNLRLPVYNVQQSTPYPEDSKDKNIFTYYPPPTTASPFPHQKQQNIKPLYTETSNKLFGLDFLDHYQKIGVFQANSDTPYPDPSNVDLTPPIPAPYKEKPSHSEGNQQFAVEAIPIRVPANFIAQANIDQHVTLEDNIRVIKVPIVPLQQNQLPDHHDVKHAENSEIRPLFGFPEQNKITHNQNNAKDSDFGKPIFFPHQDKETRPSSEQEELVINRFPFSSETGKIRFGDTFDKTESVNLNGANFHPEFAKNNRNPKHSESTLKEESSLEQLGYSPPAHIEEYQLPNGLKEIHTYHFPAPNYKSGKDRPLITKEQSTQETREITSHPRLPEHPNTPHDFRYFHIQPETSDQSSFKLTNEQIGQNKYEPHLLEHHQPIRPQYTKDNVESTPKQPGEYRPLETPTQLNFEEINSNFGNGGYLSEFPKNNQQYDFAVQDIHRPPTHDQKQDSTQAITFPLNQGAPGHRQNNQQLHIEYPIYQSETTDTNAQKYEGFGSQDNKQHHPFLIDTNYRPSDQPPSENNNHQQNQNIASELSSSNNFQPSLYQLPGYEGPKEYTIEIIAEDGDKQDPKTQNPADQDRRPYDHSPYKNEEKPQNVVPVIVAQITRRPQKPPEKGLENGKQFTSESQQSYGSFNQNVGYNNHGQNEYSQREPTSIVNVPSRVIFPPSFSETDLRPPSNNYQSHNNHPAGGYEGPNESSFNGKNIEGYRPPIKIEVEQDKKPYESSNPQAEEYRPEFLDQFPTYQQNYDESFKTSQNFAPEQQNFGESFKSNKNFAPEQQNYGESFKSNQNFAPEQQNYGESFKSNQNFAPEQQNYGESFKSNQNFAPGQQNYGESFKSNQNSAPEEQNYGESFKSNQNYDRPQDQTSESVYQDIQKQPAFYHIPVVIQPVYPDDAIDSQVETNKDATKQQDVPKPAYHQPQPNYHQHSTHQTINKQETTKKPTYRPTQQSSYYTQTSAPQILKYETFIPHSSRNPNEQLFVSGSKHSHRPSPPKSTEMKVLASHPTKPPLSKHVLKELGLDKNTKSNLYHAYYAPAHHEPPPGYVRLSLKDFKELFKNAEIHYVSSESQESSSILNNATEKSEKIHYTPPPTVYRHENNKSRDKDEQEEIITIDLKPGQTIDEALAELGTLDIGGIKLDASKLQNGDYGPVEIVEIVEEKEDTVNKSTITSPFQTERPIARKRPKITRNKQNSYSSLRNHREHSGRSSLSSQATSSREVVVPVPTTLKTPVKQVPSPSPPLKSTKAVIPKRQSTKLPGRVTTSRYQITTRTTPRTTTTTTTTTTPSTTLDSTTSPRFGHRIRPVRVKG